MQQAMKTNPDKTRAAVDALLEVPFRIDQITEAPAPHGSDAVWQRYVITQGANTIVGLCAGTHAQALAYVEHMVARLNERRLGKIRPKTK